MFERVFAESGLSLDRLRALVEVGAAGSIVRAAGGDPGRQSQYSRQIKELEDFFQTGLVERHGKGIRLTAGGRELARISRWLRDDYTCTAPTGNNIIRNKGLTNPFV